MRFTPRRLAPIALAVCALTSPASAAAGSTAKQIKTATTHGVTYLESLQQANGGFETDWVLGALAAARVASANVQAPGVATDARGYYRELVGNTAAWPGSEGSVSDYERAALNAYAAGIDPARVSVSQNLIAQIASYYEPSDPGYYGGPSDFTGTVFAALAFADAKTRTGKQRVPQALLEKSIAVLRANQHSDGGWTYEKGEGSPSKLAEAAEPDETGAVMAALCGAGVPSTDSAIVKAQNYLKSDLSPATGSFTGGYGENTDSTAWAVQGLDACGIDPQGSAFTTSAGKTPIDFLISQQLAGGGFVYEAGEAEANEYSSQDAVRALAGGGFTAAAPAAKAAVRWEYETSFQTPTRSMLTLVIDNGTPSLKVCSVTLAPSAATTTLASVLEAAMTGSQPSGCVTGLQPATGNGAITQLNGSPAPAEAKWSISIDGGKEAVAKRTSKIELGDTISLRLN